MTEPTEPEIRSRRRVFVLGDSRTGTTTIHKFLKQAGFNSIHYFFKESGVTEPAHLDRDRNWETLRSFIENSEYDAFSDYPTRSFYRELFDTYPEAYFILTTRIDVETWQSSMVAFFGKFNIPIDVEKLSNSYLKLNDDIRKIAAERDLKFAEICIDGDADRNGEILSEFLGLNEVISLGWENTTAAYDNRLWSSRVTLFNTGSKDFLGYVKRLSASTKAMLSEYGWVFLVNDSSDFLDYCYGGRTWTDENNDRAREVLEDRQTRLAAQGRKYLKFVIPEKSIVYSEYLPKLFAGKVISPHRPATSIAALGLNCFSYLADMLLDAKSRGFLYFQGDSHANWLGAYFIYLSIAEKLNTTLSGEARRAPIPLRHLRASLAAYGGDIFTQLEKESADVFSGAWSTISLGDKIEHLVKYDIMDEHRVAQQVDFPAEYLPNLGERPAFAFEIPESKLPRAVIFRDSTSDYLVKFLAEHFSRSVFIWHKGAVYEDIIEKEKADVVLHIMAERFVVQYANFRPFEKLLDGDPD